MFARILLVLLCALFVFPGSSMAMDRSGEVELAVTIAAPDDSTDVRVWIPYPVSNSEQDISNVRINGNFTKRHLRRERNRQPSPLCRVDNAYQRPGHHPDLRCHSQGIDQERFPRSGARYSC